LGKALGGVCTRPPALTEKAKTAIAIQGSGRALLCIVQNGIPVNVAGFVKLPILEVGELAAVLAAIEFCLQEQEHLRTGKFKNECPLMLALAIAELLVRA